MCSLHRHVLVRFDIVEDHYHWSFKKLLLVIDMYECVSVWRRIHGGHWSVLYRIGARLRFYKSRTAPILQNDRERQRIVSLSTLPNFHPLAAAYIRVWPGVDLANVVASQRCRMTVNAATSIAPLNDNRCVRLKRITKNTRTEELLCSIPYLLSER